MTQRPVSLVLAAMLLATASGASAAVVSVDVRGPDGRPLAGAVVTVDSPKAAVATPRGPYMVEQRDIAFQPHVLIVPVGATVGFPNRDRVRHHVYSFSRPKKFDLKLYGRDDTRSVVFDKPGVVALGCNIHDSMTGFVFVTATPFAEQTDPTGHVRIDDVPAGTATLRIWHPSIHTADNSLAQQVVVASTGFATTVAIKR